MKKKVRVAHYKSYNLAKKSAAQRRDNMKNQIFL